MKVEALESSDLFERSTDEEVGEPDRLNGLLHGCL